MSLTYAMWTLMQRGRDVLYPDQCLVCGESTDRPNAICGVCWGSLSVCDGLCCGKCGVPLPGEDQEDDVLCGECLVHDRPWIAGASATLYDGPSRRLVLSLKHHDRLEVADFAADLLASARKRLPEESAVLVPIPLHWRRLLVRNFNQAELLAARLAQRVETDLFCSDVLARRRYHPPMKDVSRAERISRLENVFEVVRSDVIEGRLVILVDDVMTTGATLADATRACYASGARGVCVLALARAAKDA
jgi:ComF family protein